jgi:hypothetical protein
VIYTDNHDIHFAAVLSAINILLSYIDCDSPILQRVGAEMRLDLFNYSTSATIIHSLAQPARDDWRVPSHSPRSH